MYSFSDRPPQPPPQQQKQHLQRTATTNTTEEQQQMKAGLRDLELALALLDNELKVEYLEAMEKCPEIVESESTPWKFYLRENGDARAAALRLAVYWRLRKEAFEGDRAFRSLANNMDADRGGALRENDYELFRSCYVAILPHSRSGHTVLISDFSRQALINSTSASGKNAGAAGGGAADTRSAAHTNQRLRFAFYFINWIAMNERNSHLSSIDGFYVIHIMDKLSVQFTMGRGPQVKDLIQNGAPVKFKKVFFVHIPEEGVDSNRFLVKLLPIGLRFASLYLRDDKIVPVFGENQQDVLKLLIRLGFNKDCLPPRVGGTWSYKLWELFLARQGLPPTVSPPQTETTATTPATAHSLQPQHPQLQLPKLQVHQYASAPPQLSSLPPATPTPPMADVLQQPQLQVPRQQAAQHHHHRLRQQNNENLSVKQQQNPQYTASARQSSGASTELLSLMTTRQHPKQQQQHVRSSSTYNNNNNTIDAPVATAASAEEEDRKMSPAGTGTTTSRKRGMTSSSSPVMTTLTTTTTAAADDDINYCSPEQLEEALETLPSPEKAAFVEAQRRVPFLVETESPLNRFFVSTDFDPSVAARRLAAYWDIRKELYGDRAFLPLTLTGSNALTEEDLAALEEGFIIVLPDDSSGHPVIALDFSVLDQKKEMVSERSFIRMLFYAMQVSAEKEASRTNGMSVLIILPQHVLFYRPPIGLDVIIQVMPVKLKMIYLMGVAPDTSRRSLLEPAIHSTLNAFSNFPADKAAIHVAETKKQLTSRLEVLGFCATGLPISVGGKWRLTAELPKWKSQQIVIEHDRINGGMAMKHSGGVYGDDDSDPEDEGDTEEGCGSESFLYQRETGIGADVRGTRGQADNEMLPSAISVGQSDVKETAAMISKGLSELEEAIELLSEEEKAALLEARECIPEIAQKEAPPVRFLRFEGYNTWAAAKRLAAYWSARKSVFEERAFLQLNQSGEGALTRDEVTSFNSGYFCPLPYDTKGRTVVCYDQSRISDYSREVRLRLTFYLFSVVSENERTQREGASVILILRSVQKDQIAQEAIKLVTDFLPVRFKALYMVNSPADSEKTTFSQSFLPIMMRLLGMLSHRAVVVVADTKVQMAEKLAKYNFAIDSLPECIGGTWSYEQFSRWQELRTRYEWDLPPVGKREKDVPHVPDYKVKLRSQLTEDEKIERKRRLNVLNSRRKRERVRVEVAVFGDQAKTLQKRNRLLKEDNKRLEILLGSAVKEIEKVEQQSESRSVLASSQSRVTSSSVREPENLNGNKGIPPKLPVGDGEMLPYSQEILNDRQIVDQLMRAQRRSTCTTTMTPAQTNHTSFSNNLGPFSGVLSHSSNPHLSQQQQEQQLQQQLKERIAASSRILQNQDCNSHHQLNAAESLAAPAIVPNRISFLMQQSQSNHILSDFQFGIPWGALFNSNQQQPQQQQQQQQQQSGQKQGNQAAPKRGRYY